MLFWGVYVSKELSMPKDPIQFFNRFMGSGYLSIYYFMFSILGIYITLPLISPLSEKKNRNILKYAIIAFFFLNTLIPDILSFFKIYTSSSLRLQFTSWLIYPLLGYYVNTTEIKKQWRIVLYVLGGAAIIYHFLITYCFSTAAGALKTPASDYTQFHVLILASAIFVFFKQMRYKLSGKAQKILHRLAGCSFGIYLIHIPILQIEQRAFGITSKNAIYRFLCPFLTYAICVCIVLILKKIPLLRKIVP